MPQFRPTLALSAGRVLLLLLLTAMALSAPAAPQTTPALVDFEKYRGKIVLMDFWASWCAPCRRSFPWMDSMARKYTAEGLVVIAVNVDESRAAADEFLEGTDYQIEIIYDPQGELAEAWDLEAMPSSILFDRQGRATFRHTGFVPADTKTYERNLVELLEGRGPITPELASRAGRKRGGVRPWEKGLMALESMTLSAGGIDLAWDDHIYFSREASSGGRGFGGGGCGCN